MIKFRFAASAALLLACVPAMPVLAQGQDGAPAERDIQILSTLFPGLYNNSNQAYFEQRLETSQERRRGAMSFSVERVDAPQLGEVVLAARQSPGAEDAPDRHWLYVLSVDEGAGAVRMKTYGLPARPDDFTGALDLRYAKNCDLLWRQEAGQFRGRLEKSACRLGGGRGAYDMQLSQDSLWVRADSAARDPFQMLRARHFSCYVDAPAVGGGRDIPHERFDLGKINDLGGSAWISTRDGEEIGVTLWRVVWPMNNYKDAFARPSLVIYVSTKDEEGEAKEVGYSWTHVSAERIGINLKFMLANCAMTPGPDVAPFYKYDEPLVRR